jgi:hypothetical protein
VIKYILNGREMSYSYKRKGETRKLSIYNLKQMNTPNPRNWKLDEIPNGYKTTSPTSELLSRMLAEKCEYCSAEKGYFEVHHVRKLADIKGKCRWEKVMIARHRKTLILCVECHQLLHAGKLSDARFKRNTA